MYYEDRVIEEVRALNDIVDVIGQVVHLERKGANYFGLCPFHNEKTPSFSVSGAKQMFYCFGCGQGGNVFSFVQKYDNLTWTEAVERLAERAGYALPVKGDPEKAKQALDKRRRLFAVNKEAATWYYHLLHEKEGEKGLAYLTKRGLTLPVIKRFGLGFAPVSKDALLNHLKEQGFTEQEAVDAGLAVRDERDGARDKFWNRVMFPIQDVQRRVIGFGGRVMGDGEPKYLNSPETAIFDKGRNLYGLMYASKARKGRIILCEGYMDVIAMHRAGFTEACASLGTAFTPGQAQVLKRYTDEVLLAYDSDEAGTKAALRGIRLLREAGLFAKVITLSPYKDPDELIVKEGAGALDKRIREALNPFYYEIAVAERDYALSDPQEATAFHHLIADKLVETFPEAMERENYLQAICARYHIDPAGMKEAVARGSARIGVTAAPAVRRRSERQAPSAGAKSERMLLSFLAEDAAVFPVVKEHLSPEDFTEPMCRKLAEFLYRELEEGSAQPAALIDRLSEEEREEAARILSTPVDVADNIRDKERALHDMLYEVMKRAYEVMCDTADPADPSYLTKTIEGKKRLDAFRRKEISLS